jgi:hypothetical protein
MATPSAPTSASAGDGAASALGEEREDRGGELRRGKRAGMISRHADEPGVRQERRQLAGVGALVLIDDRDKRRYGMLPWEITSARCASGESGSTAIPLTSAVSTR